jgi:hypothetical protein
MLGQRTGHEQRVQVRNGPFCPRHLMSRRGVNESLGAGQVIIWLPFWLCGSVAWATSWLAQPAISAGPELSASDAVLSLFDLIENSLWGDI